ncbi:DNA/RNA helicase, DEAD/DEAH box type, N-terminal [Artemisia annua]|uniref:DNA/RNA helicase, DEAD/DEAH box type, N-terminal n=1 Tax=Artemisia annua TaxID=35608 RepID=A0A2U1LIA6_ARTAN|nr:DNA/RNA helicase, DEAD/DEAH box type, N-terminal [Artemisia annua]
MLLLHILRKAYQSHRRCGPLEMQAWGTYSCWGKIELPSDRPSERSLLGLDVLASAKRVEGSFKVPRPKVSSMMASIDEDVEKSSLADQDDVGSGVSSSDSSGSKTFDSEKHWLMLYQSHRRCGPLEMQAWEPYSLCRWSMWCIASY